MSNPPYDPNQAPYPQSGPPGSDPTSGAAGYPTSGGPDQQGAYGYQAPPPGYPGDDVDPVTGEPLSDKTKLVAGLLGILLGGFGVGRFYTGHTGLGVAQLIVSLVTCGLGAWWGIIDGIIILVNGGTDAQGRKLREN